MQSRFLRNFGLLTLTALLVASPALTYAKGNNNGKGKAPKQDKQEQNEEQNENEGHRPKSNPAPVNNSKDSKTCFRAFGHLIAPGFIKNKGQVSFFGDCFLPFGIAKKFGGNTGTSTPDTTAPSITNLTLRPQVTTAEIAWRTDEPADGTVFWSASSPVDVNNSATQNVTAANSRTRDHLVRLTGLSATTTYYVIVRSKDPAGNTSFSSEQSFVTKAAAPDTNPPVISAIAVLTGTSTINVGWKTNENATSRVYYGTSSALDVNSSATLFVESTNSVKDHLMTLTGLAASTTYYLAIESKDPAGNRTVTPTFTAMTGGLPADTVAPLISNIVTNVGTSSVAVSWDTNELASSKLFYSTLNPLDLTASTTNLISTGTLVLNHFLQVLGLATSTPYWFVIQSVDGSGNVGTSAQFGTTTASGL